MPQRILRPQYGLLEGVVALALLWGTNVLLGLPVRWPLLVLASCGTVLVYLADRHGWPGPEDAGSQKAFRGRGAIVTGVLAVAGGLAVLPFLQPRTLLWGGLLGAVGVLYNVPLGSPGVRLKRMGGLKPVLVAAGWASGAVALPVIEAGVPWTTTAFALLLYRFLFVLPNVLLADWVDRETDRAAGIATLAVRRPQGWHVLAVASAGLALTGVFTAVVTGRVATLWLVDAIGPLLMLALLLRPRQALGPAQARLADMLVAWPLVTALWGTLM